MSPRICMALAAIFICLCPLTAGAQARRINGYALQVAALSSRRSADTLARGLSAQGMNAYWIGGQLYSARGASEMYRVRIGNFQTIASANTYAVKLLNAGLLESYAITAYESPVKGDSVSTVGWKIQSFAQKRPQRGIQFGDELIDVVASIGSRGWLLLSSESINLTVRNGSSTISRELVDLAAAIGARGWSLNNNIANFRVASAPANIVSLPSEIITNAPPAPSAISASSSGIGGIGPEIGRGGLTPTSSTSMRIGSTPSRSGYNPPARLQGSIELREGRMWVTLRNADPDRVFSGVARISLSDDQKQQDVTPINVTLLPDKETEFPLDEARLTDGAWILMVYDQNGTARLIRGASLVPPKAPTNSAQPVDPNSAAAAPPSYVTGVYDTTNWTQPEVPPQIEGAGSAGAQANEPQANVLSAQNDVNAQANTQNDVGSAASSAAAGSPNATPEAENGPGQVSAVLRQIAVTNDNATLELEISAQ
ncbi:MAG TPA: SPOR domain-containing protein, partial [Blastocatellia bacterium]